MNLRRAVSDALVARGYKRRDRSLHLPLDGEFSFCVDTGPLGKRADIAPFVGLRYEPVEALLPQLLGVPPDAWVATAGGNVGYVLGREYQWWEPPATADEVLEAIDEALRYLRPYMNDQRFAELWKREELQDATWRYREVILRMLQGQRKEAFDRLEDARKYYCQQENEVCQQFQEFARNVQTRLDGSVASTRA